MLIADINTIFISWQPSHTNRLQLTCQNCEGVRRTCIEKLTQRRFIVKAMAIAYCFQSNTKPPDVK